MLNYEQQPKGKTMTKQTIVMPMGNRGYRLEISQSKEWLGCVVSLFNGGDDIVNSGYWYVIDAEYARIPENCIDDTPPEDFYDDTVDRIQASDLPHLINRATEYVQLCELPSVSHARWQEFTFSSYQKDK